jgi:hypothetical protein
MNFLFDLRPDINLSHFDRLKREAADVLGSPRVSLYACGSLEPPRSDIDLISIVDDDFSANEARRLTNAFLGLRARSADNTYLLPARMGICARGFWPNIFYVFPRLRETNYRHLAGPAVPFPSTPHEKEHKTVELLDRALFGYHSVSDLAGRESSLRETLSRLHKINVFVLPILFRYRNDVSLETMGKQLEAVHAFKDKQALTEEDRQILERTVNEASDILRAFFIKVCDEVIPLFIRADVNRTKEAPSAVSRYYLPPIYHCFRQAYFHLAERDSLLKRRFRFEYPRYHFEVTDAEFGDFLKKQMRLVGELEHAVRNFGPAYFKARVGGVWHTPDPIKAGTEYRKNLLKEPFRRPYSWLRERFVRSR